MMPSRRMSGRTATVQGRDGTGLAGARYTQTLRAACEAPQRDLKRFVKLIGALGGLRTSPIEARTKPSTSAWSGAPPRKPEDCAPCPRRALRSHRYPHPSGMVPIQCA